MKTISFFSILSLLLFVTACSKDKKDIDITTDQEFTLQYEQKGIFNEGGFTILFDEVISEGRCPANVDCVWEGSAVIKLVVMEGSKSTDIELATSDVLEGESTTAGYNNYLIQMVDLDPYPQNQNPIPDKKYSVVLKVSKQ